MKKKQYLYTGLFISLLLSSTFTSNTSLSAQVKCEGTGCSLVPTLLLDSSREQFEEQLQSTYITGIAQQFSDAGALISTGTPYIGDVQIEHLTIGLQFQNSVGKSIVRESFLSESQTFLTDIRRDGYAVGGSLFIGFNLGGLVDWFGISEGKSFFAPSRFEFIGSYGALNLKFSNFYKYPQTRFSYQSFYVGTRYRIVHQREVTPLFKWLGLSFLIGYSDFKTNIDVDGSDGESEGYSIQIGDFSWGGGVILGLTNTTKTIPMEIATGIGVLGFLNLTAAAGLAPHASAKTNLNFIRSGELSDSNGPIDANLSVNLSTESNIRKVSYYAKIGFEIDVPFVRFGLEASFGRNNTISYLGSLRFTI